MENVRIRRFFSLSAVAVMAAVITACGGGSGGGGGSSGGDSGGGDTPLPPLTFYLSLSPGASANGEVVTPVEIVTHEPDTGAFGRFTTVAAAPAQIDAFHRVDDQQFYFSLSQHAQLGGLVVAPGDVLFSDNGALSMALDASTAGLPDGVNLDALTRSSEGDFIVSTDIHFAVGGERFEDADLIRHDGSTFTLYRSATDLGLDNSADIDAVSLRANGDLALSLKTRGQTAASLVYASSDVVLASETEGITGVALAAGTELTTPAGVNSLSDNR